MSSLTGKQYEALNKALVEAFPSPTRLRMMLRFKLDKNLDEIAMGDDLREIVFKLIGKAEAEAWTVKLIAAARVEPGPPAPPLLGRTARARKRCAVHDLTARSVPAGISEEGRRRARSARPRNLIGRS